MPAQPYRNDAQALNDRLDQLRREIGELKAQTKELDQLRARERELEEELREVERKAGARRALPMLDQIKVAAPCSANWNEMVGDDRVRFCGSCAKNVYNLSAMSREEAESLIAEREASMCVRFYQRADGTVMTEDCPVGAKKRRRKKIALAVAGAGAIGFAALASMERSSHCTSRATMGAMGPAEMGDIGPPEPPVKVTK